MDHRENGVQVVSGVESEHLREEERRAGRDGWAGLALNPALSARAATGSHPVLLIFLRVRAICRLRTELVR